MRNLSSLALLVAAWETFIQTSSHSWYTLWRALLGYNHKIRVKLSNARLQSLQRSEKSALKWKSKTKCARRRERKKKWKPTMNTKQIWEWRRLRGFKKYGTNIYMCVCMYVCVCVWRCNNLCAQVCVWPHVIQTCTMCAMHVRTCPSRASGGTYFGFGFNCDGDGDGGCGCAVNGNGDCDACRCIKLSMLIADAKQRRQQRCRRCRCRCLNTT